MYISNYSSPKYGPVFKENAVIPDGTREYFLEYSPYFERTDNIQRLFSTAQQLIEKPLPSGKYVIRSSRISRWIVENLSLLFQYQTSKAKDFFDATLPFITHTKGKYILKLCEIDEVLRKKADSPEKKMLLEEICNIAQEYIFNYRHTLLPYNKWNNERNISAVQLLIFNHQFQGSWRDFEFPTLVHHTFWKTLFQDDQAYTAIFKRCTNSLSHFAKSELEDFLNAFGKFRKDEEAFTDLVRYHYETIEKKVIPNLDKLDLDPETRGRLENCWSNFSSKIPERMPGFPILEDERCQALFENLYTSDNRRLYPGADPVLLRKVPLEKEEWAALVIKGLNEETTMFYEALLRDKHCTRHALAAYLNQKISYEQFLSLCMAWSAVNAYDPEMKTSKIVSCRDPSIRSYFHNYNSPTWKHFYPNIDEDIDKILQSMLQKKPSEQFVLLMDFKISYCQPLLTAHSHMMSEVGKAPYFFFPNKDKWIVPSFSLLDSALYSLYGPDYVRPLPGFGDFTLDDLLTASKKGMRPFQLCMKDIPNTPYADSRTTIRFSLLADPLAELIDPSLWLHDLFHLNVVSEIPKNHREFFNDLAEFLKKEKIKEAYKRCVDMVFTDYGSDEYSEIKAFNEAIAQILRKENAKKKNRAMNFIHKNDGELLKKHGIPEALK